MAVKKDVQLLLALVIQLQLVDTHVLASTGEQSFELAPTSGQGCVLAPTGGEYLLKHQLVKTTLDLDFDCEEEV